jgi:hypothetical protein
MVVYSPFKLDKACDALETLARQQDRSSPELGAIEVSAHALLFIFAPRPPNEEPDRPDIEVSVRAMRLTWSSQSHSFVAYLSSWVEAMRMRATDEQRQFLREIGLDGVQEEDSCRACSVSSEEEQEARPGHDLETRPFAKTLPEPAHAVSILEALARRYDPSTAAHACIEVAMNALRFLLDTRQVDAFCAELDEERRQHTPTAEMDLPALA